MSFLSVGLLELGFFLTVYPGFTQERLRPAASGGASCGPHSGPSDPTRRALRAVTAAGAVRLCSTESLPLSPRLKRDAIGAEVASHGDRHRGGSRRQHRGS